MKLAQLVVVSLVGLVACVSAGCSSSSNPATADSGADHPGATSDAADSGAQQLPTGVMSPPQPEVPCSGSDTTACTLPPSACALMTSCGSCPAPWVVFYESPRCDNGHCVWHEGYFQCQNGSSNCSFGGCQPMGTTTAVPVQ